MASVTRSAVSTKVFQIDGDRIVENQPEVERGVAAPVLSDVVADADDFGAVRFEEFIHGLLDLGSIDKAGADVHEPIIERGAHAPRARRASS